MSWRLVLTVIVVITAVIYVIPSIRPEIWPHKKINLGLDLQGGMHLVLEVETDKAVESTIERINQEMRELFRKERIRRSFCRRSHTDWCKNCMDAAGYLQRCGSKKSHRKRFVCCDG